MAAGDVFSKEGRTFTDSHTGAAVHQLTDWRAHSHHIYFTNESLWDGGRRLLISSERNNCRNLFSIELAGGELTQLTGFGPKDEPSIQSACLNPRRDEVYFVHKRQVIALDLRTLRQRVVFATPAGYNPGNVAVTADGATLVQVLVEDLTGRVHTDMQHGYVGFVETFEAKPHSQIVAMPVDGGPLRVLHEDNCWIGHVNPSHVLPGRLTFCHEGPWHRLQRLWAMDIATGRVWQLRPQKPPEQRIGHEYWLADGRRVGYHGWLSPGEPIWGFVNEDGTGRREWTLSEKSMHFHSIDETMFVGDGWMQLPYLLLWRQRDGHVEGPRRLAVHRASFQTQYQHPHPRMFRDGDGRVRVMYTGDHNGYANVFIVDVPEFESLPVHE